MLVSLYYSDLNHLTVETRTNVRLNIVWANRTVLLLYGLTTWEQDILIRMFELKFFKVISLFLLR